jgi:uncharacterized protein (TIGR03437 family)
MRRYLVGTLVAMVASAQLVPIETLRWTVLHAATGDTVMTPDTGVAPGSLIAIESSLTFVIGPEELDVAAIYADRGSSRSVPLEIVARERGRVIALIPRDFEPGPMRLRVVSSSGGSSSKNLTVVSSNFGLYTRDRFGVQPAVAQNIIDGEVELQSLTRPAVPGGYVTLWGTGLGAGSAAVSVIVAGRSVARAEFAGAAPGLPGVDQINFAVPLEAPYSCYVSVQMVVNGKRSSEATLAIGDRNQPCEHPLGLSPDQVRQLDRGEQILLAQGQMRSEVSQSYVSRSLEQSESAYLRFERANAAMVAAASPKESIEQTGGCRAFSQSAGIIAFIVPSDLDAGSTLVLSGPNQARYELEGPGFYSLPLRFGDPVVDPSNTAFPGGNWILTAPGGSTVAPFAVPFRNPNLVRGSYETALTGVTRQANLVVIWNGSDFADPEMVRLSVEQVVPEEAFRSRTIGAECYVPAAIGRGIIPATLLAGIPEPDSSIARQTELSIEVRQEAVTFPVPLRDGTAGAGVVRPVRRVATFIDLR